MSYSFQFVIQTKAEAEAKLAEEFDKVVASQPTHAQDRAPAIAAALAFINLLADEPDKDIQVGVNGWLSWPYQPAEPADPGAIPLQGAAVSATVALIERKT
ncbi:hypothetical protein [Burkholderia pseudomallei]|uniref:hypothetical protein n=1 Tax=Burkholderia pseudomallei TaxID=28450 RepID=UPI00190BD414|nr:hypothetical protein [Burkholderia pseudomallei]MBK3333540.1 hypothetical protein [Burkholderia pseudomallei]